VATPPAVTPPPTTTAPPAVATTTPPPAQTTPPPPEKTETPEVAKTTPEVPTQTPPGAAPRKSRSYRPAFYVSAGTAAVALVTGLVCGVVSKTTANSLNSKYENRSLSVSDRGSYDTVRTTATVANVSYGIAGVGAIVAGIIFATHPTIFGAGGDEPPPVSVGLSGVTVGGRF
jgi:hypothetical protein